MRWRYLILPLLLSGPVEAMQRPAESAVDVTPDQSDEEAEESYEGNYNFLSKAEILEIFDQCKSRKLTKGQCFSLMASRLGEKTLQCIEAGDDYGRCVRMLLAAANLSWNADLKDKALRTTEIAVDLAEQALAESARDRINAYRTRARLLADNGALSGAEKLYRKALDAAQRHYPDDAAYIDDISSALAGLLYDQGQYERSRALAQKSYDFRLGAYGEEDRRTAIAMSRLAFIHMGRGEPSEAEPLFRKSLALARAGKARGLDLSRTINNLAICLKHQSKLGEAADLSRESLALKLGSLHSTSADISLGYRNLATILIDQKKLSEAATYLERAVEILEQDDKANPIDLFYAYNNLAGLHVDRRNFVAARDLYLKALTLADASISRDNPPYMTLLNNLAIVYSNLGQADEARRYYHLAVASRRKTLRDGHPDTAMAISSLAVFEWSQGNRKEALRLQREAFRMTAFQPAVVFSDRIRHSWFVAKFLQESGGPPAEARTLYREAARGVHERVASFRDFGPAAQEELKKYRPIFTGQVEVAWRLAQTSE